MKKLHFELGILCALVWLAVTMSLFCFLSLCCFSTFSTFHSVSLVNAKFMAFSKTRLQSYNLICLTEAVHPKHLFRVLSPPLISNGTLLFTTVIVFFCSFVFLIYL